jgi:hypothetical protein
LFCKNNSIQQDGEDKSALSTQTSNIVHQANINLKPTEPGTVKCKARNSAGNANVDGLVKIGDLAEPFAIKTLNDNQIAQGDYVKLECGATVYDYKNDITWYKDDDLIVSNNHVQIIEVNENFAFKKSIVFEEISQSDDGTFKCEVTDKSGQTHERSVVINVYEAQAPIITPNFNQSKIVQPFGQSLTLECLFFGLPIPTLNW